jgi:hypothetical protein
MAAIVHGKDLISVRGFSADMFLATHHEATKMASVSAKVRFPATDSAEGLDATFVGEPIKAISKASRKKSATRTIDRECCFGC